MLIGCPGWKQECVGQNYSYLHKVSGDTQVRHLWAVIGDTKLAGCPKPARNLTMCNTMPTFTAMHTITGFEKLLACVVTPHRLYPDCRWKVYHPK